MLKKYKEHLKKICSYSNNRLNKNKKLSNNKNWKNKKKQQLMQKIIN